MTVLQVFQAKILWPGPSDSQGAATDLALCATKTTPQAFRRSMASLVVLERHLWLMLTEIKDADKVPFLDAPISPNGLFGLAVEGFAERFTEAQKLSQAMRHFLPKRSSSTAAPSRPKPMPTQQPTKPAPAAPAAQPVKTQQTRGRSRLARRYPFPKRQGPRPKIALDPAPQASSWSARQEEDGDKFRYSWTTPQAASLKPPITQFNPGCRGKCVCCEFGARSSTRATNRCYSGTNKTNIFRKRANFLFLFLRVPCPHARSYSS